MRAKTSANECNRVLSNFITRKPVQKLAEINRIDQKRYFDIKAGVLPGLSRSETDAAGVEKDNLINANERIAFLTRYLEANPLPPGVSWEWTGDQEDEAESQAFLSKAFIAALALMFIILLAQFNSFFNSFIVLLAVVLSTVGVLIGMLVMQQAFSIIMTGTGIVALAGIVVNNNIVLIDTYQELSRYMPRIEAIIRTAEQRIRPVLLTTITTMAITPPATHTPTQLMTTTTVRKKTTMRRNTATTILTTAIMMATYELTVTLLRQTFYN